MTQEKTIYLDYNATVPIKPQVIHLMADIMGTVGNASSVHRFGREARKHIEKAREQVAALASTQPSSVIFTSGATEANNAVLNAFKNETIFVSATEHPSIRNVDANAIKVPVKGCGLVDMDALASMIDEHNPSLISVMLVNNETGVIQPVGEIARLAKKKNKDIFVHTDAVQAGGKIKIDMPALNVDYLSLSGHKFGGPQGVGALLIAPGARPAKLLHGGGQEKRQRAGTENIAGIAGFGLAAQLAEEKRQDFAKLEQLRDKLESHIKKIAPEVNVYGAQAPRVPNTTALCLAGMPAETQLMNLDLAGIAVSSGSACSSGSFSPSPVLQAMGASDNEASSTLRISMGWATEEAEIDRFIEVWSEIYARMKDKIKSKAHA